MGSAASIWIARKPLQAPWPLSAIRFARSVQRPAGLWWRRYPRSCGLCSILRLRQTGGVLLELIDAGTSDLQLAMPFVDETAVEYLLTSLLEAGRRGARVTVVTSTTNGQKFAALVRRWPREASGELRVTEVATHLSPLGSHAKALVVDRTRGYVGSANLTSAGLSRNVEIGVELFGPQVADLSRLLSALERLGTTVDVVRGSSK